MIKLGSYLLRIAGLLILMAPLSYWLQHPELSQLQVWLHWWWTVPAGYGSFMLGDRMAK